MSKLVAEFKRWRDGWKKEETRTWRQKQFAEPIEEKELTPALVRRCLFLGYKHLAPILRPTPMFFVTDFGEGESKGQEMGIAAWACTWTGKKIDDIDDFFHEKCPKSTRRHRETMFRLAKHVDNDWTVCPLLVFFLRQALHFAPAVNPDHAAADAVQEHIHRETAMGKARAMHDGGGGLLGLVEADYPMLPGLQFLDSQGNKQMRNMNQHETMHMLRVGPRILEAMHGREIRGKADLRPLDVDLTVFLIRRNLTNNGFVKNFDAAVSAFRKELKTLLRTEVLAKRNPAAK